MSFKKEEERAERKVYTPAEYDELREGMKKFSLRKTRAGLFTPFHQYMVEKGVISFDEEWHGIGVINPSLYTKYNEMRSRIEAMDDARLKEILDSNPEEKEAWRRRIAEVGKSMRGILYATRVDHGTDR